MKELKWGCIQPLTGGMYIGARNAIGKPADWVISYPGLTDTKKDNNGNLTKVANEYHLLDWCKRNNELPKYKIFNKKPFEQMLPNDVELIDDPVWSTGDIDLSNTDIVVSVPVCSGLSQATIANEDTKNERNYNMIFNATWALKIVQPKVYIFENAPTLFTGASAKPVRDIINALGEKYGYSVIYYKTDTKLHDNCQRRPRTFVVMVRQDGNKTGAPLLGFENIKTSILDFFARIPENASQQFALDLNEEGKCFLGFVKYKYGDNYREIAQPWTIGNIINNNLWEEFYEYMKITNVPQYIQDKLHKLCDHIQYKLSLGKNFYCLVPAWTRPTDETIASCMFKQIPFLMHFKEERNFTIREWLHMMGHPHDFIMHGDCTMNYAQIGQNVPARTAQWIVSEAVRLVENWDTIDRTGDTVKYIDNIKQKVL